MVVKYHSGSKSLIEVIRYLKGASLVRSSYINSRVFSKTECNAIFIIESMNTSIRAKGEIVAK